MYELKEINGKKIFIVESHHHALLPWGLIKRGFDDRLVLLSLDHHTDCRPAFHAYRCTESKFDDLKYAQMLDPLIAKFNYRDDKSVVGAIDNLKYDEQIHTAILGGIFTHSFSLNYSDQTPSIEDRTYQKLISAQFQKMIDEGIPLDIVQKPEVPRTYDCPEDGMFTIASDCYLGCNKIPHDDDCLISLYSQAIESDYLDHQLAVANQMSITSGLGPLRAWQYVLDIDLDYFHSIKSIGPNDANTFYALIRNSEALTIAMERRCVELLRLEGQVIDSEILLKKLLEHIHKATA